MIIPGFNPASGRPPAHGNERLPASSLPELIPEVPLAFSSAQMLERSAQALNRNLENMLRCQPNINKVVGDLLNGGSAESSIAEFAEQTQAKRIRSQMWAQQAQVCCSVMKSGINTLSEEQLQQVLTEQKRVLGELNSEPVPTEVEDQFEAVINSPNDFFEKLLELIELIKNGYLAGYEHIIAAYSDFFADFNKEITAQMKDWIEGANDGKEVKLNAGAIRAALQSLINKYSHPNPAAVLFPAPGMEGATREEAEKWRLALGLPANCLQENDDGTYSVVMDLGPLTIMKDSLPSGGTVTWDTSKFQAWQTGFNAQEERMKNMLQSFTQKYSNANSYHDNFNKTLSSHLNQFTDMLKAMLNF
ncbi:IpaD/SipD/SspD family type III secretion system needle tip protein [Pseudomonas sp. QTF5]|uniref:IpaD/SipD/SspD family type III secretion system needle tip protein n=1 Tax=Pseudomonas sp. QTF5 TaxID=1435425 RepID=UPI0004BE343A|nr:IpaD/SipD/SspD family type III secretion system needle tip protein [Pseudomonas sp. QTF5]